MSDKQRLRQWMEQNGYDYRSLAAATGDTRTSIHMMVYGNRSVNQAFMWRFANAFGFNEAKKVFVETRTTKAAARTLQLA
jgi:transcriptional regulator with XRE-family HTH domain